MKKEDKELLLKDLSTRVPYGVKALVKNWSGLDMEWIENEYVVRYVYPYLNEVHVHSESGSVNVILGHDDYDIKPYLFPMSSMTKEQNLEYSKTYVNLGFTMAPTPETFDWLNKNHIDYRHLIEKGLALDATGLNIY